MRRDLRDQEDLQSQAARTPAPPKEGARGERGYHLATASQPWSLQSQLLQVWLPGHPQHMLSCYLLNEGIRQRHTKQNLTSSSQSPGRGGGFGSERQEEGGVLVSTPDVYPHTLFQ